MVAYNNSVRNKQTFLLHLRADCAARLLVPGARKQLRAAAGVPSLLNALANNLKCDLPTFYEAIPVGADLTQVRDRWFLWLLTDELGKYKTSAPVAKLYRRRLAGDEPTKEEWQKARKNAYADATDATYAADAAAYATYAADAADAADAAAAAASAAADRKAGYARCQQALFRLVGESPLGVVNSREAAHV